MKTMKPKPDKWTVTCRESSVDNKMVPATSPLRAEKRYEWRLHYEGMKVHSLDGLNSGTTLQKVADQWNLEGYSPKIIKGKVYMDLTTSQKLKLALESSPPLPFEES